MSISKCFITGATILAALSMTVIAQSIDITGTVVDSANSAAISGATVSLVEFPQFATTTNTSGSFSLTGTATTIHPISVSGSHPAMISLRDNALTISSLLPSEKVLVKVYSSRGSQVIRKNLLADAQGVAKCRNLWKAEGFYQVKIQTSTGDYSIAGLSGNNMAATLSSVQGKALEKVNAAYTLRITASNYIAKNISLDNATGDAGTIRLARLAVQTGTWLNVTPSGFLNGSFGALDVLADPVRPGDFYAFNEQRGVWKSTNFGANWTKLTAAGVMDGGAAWGEAIDPNPNRNPNTPPTMFACQGRLFPLGSWKSTDGGINWHVTQLSSDDYDNDIYGHSIEPANSNHIIVSGHARNNIWESTDCGATWSNKGPAGGAGISNYVYFLNNSSTWLTIAQEGYGDGTSRTTNSGASWTLVNNGLHAHGVSQLWTAPNGDIYEPCDKGIYRSTNNGANWTLVSTRRANVIVGTATKIYAMDCGAVGPGVYLNPQFQIGSLSNPASWTAVSTPASLYNGGKMATAYDTSIGKYVIVAACWDAGMWRYIEP